jgi:hypothetical protein
LLEKLEASAKRYESFIAKDAPQESKSFRDAGREWTQTVTGVDASYRLWNSFVLDEDIRPRLHFDEKFKEICESVHQYSEAGRRFFLNLFLVDIIRHEKFVKNLRLFPELELSVTESVGAKKRRLQGRTDYTIGFGKGLDILHETIPHEVHVVAIEAKVRIGQKDLLQCIAEAATLYKTRKNAGKADKRVWGIISNAETWIFIFIDNDGLLWQSAPLLLNIRSYDESQVLQVYRMVYYIVNCCNEACSPHSSTSSLFALTQ